MHVILLSKTRVWYHYHNGYSTNNSTIFSLLSMYHHTQDGSGHSRYSSLCRFNTKCSTPTATCCHTFGDDDNNNNHSDPSGHLNHSGHGWTFFCNGKESYRGTIFCHWHHHIMTPDLRPQSKAHQLISLQINTDIFLWKICAPNVCNTPLRKWFTNMFINGRCKRMRAVV